ncbi:MAG: acetyl-CoA carboxylase biotin carboxyl carrier protein subunit [Nevskia sp.]|nr:acetyl-CoA carboxylase biotin carboxyl carrier protein subunit [Nevskia sp.]
MHHAFRLNDAEYNLELSRAPAGYRLHLADRTVPVNLHLEDDGSAVLTVNGRSEKALVATRGDDVFIHLGGVAYQLRYEHPLQRLAAQSQGSAEDHVRAPMPGSLVALHARPGQTVARGESLLVMESMKMETTIAAPRDGIVELVHFSIGQTFDRDAVLLELKHVD